MNNKENSKNKPYKCSIFTITKVLHRHLPEVLYHLWNMAFEPFKNYQMISKKYFQLTQY